MLIRLTLAACAFVLVAAAVGQQPEVPASNALVTFYSRAVTIKGGLAGQSLGAFRGRIFDGDRQLAFMETSRFITFRVSPGAHLFSAVSWMNKNADHGAHLTLSLEASQHYFVEVGTTTLGPPFVIRQVPCEKAASENPHIQSLEAKHLKPAGLSIAVNEPVFPSCQ